MMAHRKVLGCLIAVGGTHVVYFQKSKELNMIWFTSSFGDQPRYSTSDSPAVTAENVLERIVAAESDFNSLSMSSDCKTWYLRDENLQIALIIKGRCSAQNVEGPMKQIIAEITTIFEDDGEDIPLYILRIRCRSITAPILRRFQRRSVEGISCIIDHSVYRLCMVNVIMISAMRW